MNGKYRLLTLFLACLLIAGLLSGCSRPGEKAGEPAPAQTEQEPVKEPEPAKQPEPEKKPDPQPAKQPEPVKEPEPAEEVFRNPLTGEVVDEDISKLRPYCVMINNIRVSTPPRGVKEAEMVFELMDEGGITRTQVFFMDFEGVDNVGSIRSARQYNVETALAFDAFLVHCGGSEEALNYIYSRRIQDIDAINGNYIEGTFYRDPSRSGHGSEHTLFAYGEALDACPEGLQFRREPEAGYDCTYGLLFDANAVSQCGEGAKAVHVTYSGGKTTDFTYDEATKTYTAWQYGAEYADDGVDIVPFKNVLVIDANTHLQSDGLHLTIELTGGDGWFITEGKRVAIKWYREGTDDFYHFTLEDGTPLKLGIGKTFVAVNQTGAYYNGTVEFE